MQACGEVECVRIAVECQQYDVPTQLDLVHFELTDDRGVFMERSYELTPESLPPVLRLCPGPRTPDKLTLVIYGLLADDLVAQSVPRSVRFDGEHPVLEVALP
jgi:hypothetical protein